MITLPLRLSVRDRPVRPAAAWLIPAGDPAVWLDEICRWGVPMRGIRIYVLPESTTTRVPLGALVTVRVGEPRTSPATLPYGRVGKNLYVPTESELHPAVSAAECEELLSSAVVVFHPGVGLVGFDETDAMSLAGLLEPPRRGGDPWRSAEPGVVPRRRIDSLAADGLPSVDEAIQGGREDIGTTPPGTIPARSSEPADGTVAEAGRAVAYGLAKGTHFVLENIAKGLEQLSGASPPGPDGSSGLVDKWLHWADGVTASLRSRIESARYREITRLVELLKRDTDEGLRYALPLAGLAHRGIAPPSTRLGRRRVDFSLSALVGGKAADLWEVPPHIVDELRRSYLEAARREIGLGRHRRAAYIYAQLLGDHHAAADVLRQGHHYREAAVLYRDRLRKTLLAAECLEEGGFLEEAIELYREKKRFEKVAELYAALGDHENSLHAYRRVAAASLKQGDRVHAARIVETRLGEPRQALAILSAGWPDSSQAAPCLKEQFALMGRMGWHKGAAHAVDLFKGLPLRAEMLGVLVTGLVRVAGTYPDLNVRRRAADTVRVVIGRRLPDADGDEVARLTRCLAQLDPSDRLLERDAQRYCAEDRVRKRVAARTAGRRVSGRSAPELVRQVALLPGVAWERFAATRRGLYAAGCSSVSSYYGVLRRDWGGELAFARWEQATAAIRTLTVDASRQGPVIVLVDGDEGLAPQELRGAGAAPEMAGTPEWLTAKRCLACAYSRSGTLQGLVSTSTGLGAMVFGPRGETLRLEPVEFDAMVGDLEPLAVSLGDDFWFSLGRWLHVATAEGDLRRIEIDGEIRSLYASPHGCVPRVVVTTETGGCVVWAGERLGEVEAFARDLDHPLAGFTSDGHLILLSRGESRVYPPESLRAPTTFASSDPNPLAVLPTNRSGEFAVATRESVKVFRLPKE